MSGDIALYDRDAAAYARQYESLDFEQVHGSLLDLLPGQPGLVLDVGAGSGRDAAWFAGRGHEVLAVEPAAGLRALGRTLHPEPAIRWVDDRLPGLPHVSRRGTAYDLIWVSAVWMHLPPAQRGRAFRKLAALLQPGGRLVVTLRRGASPDARTMYPVEAVELETLAREHGLGVLAVRGSDDGLGRKGVAWQSVVLEAPDDGLGALPLLRHIILNDSKSSTYKLALLRVLVRIADSAPGLAEPEDELAVALPLGLVALYWLRAFKPLIEAGVPQMPPNARNAGPGFVKAGFRALRGVSGYSLRVGARFSGPEAAALLAALRDARRTIVTMPTHFITYPNSDQQLLVAEAARAPGATQFTLDAAFLRHFGTLRIPRHLWLALSRYAAWIEPALLEAWHDLMSRYEGHAERGRDRHFALLRWLDPVHETGPVRNQALALRGRGRRLHCVWSGRALEGDFAIDHCLPFAAWPCNDLWNLLPSHPRVNALKGGRLPALEALAGARERILAWWQAAYVEQEAWSSRFFQEAAAALPGAEAGPVPAPEAVFDALMDQRAVLQRDLQLQEWPGR